MPTIASVVDHNDDVVNRLANAAPPLSEATRAKLATLLKAAQR
jgi:hypothetical protein